MTTHITIEQHIEELRAEYRGAPSKRERRRILDDLWLCERILVRLEWKAEAEVCRAR